MGCGASSAEYTEPRGDGKSGLYWAPTEQIHKLARSTGAASIESKMLVNQVAMFNALKVGGETLAYPPYAEHYLAATERLELSAQKDKPGHDESKLLVNQEVLFKKLSGAEITDLPYLPVGKGAQQCIDELGSTQNVKSMRRRNSLIKGGIFSRLLLNQHALNNKINGHAVPELPCPATEDDVKLAGYINPMDPQARMPDILKSKLIVNQKALFSKVKESLGKGVSLVKWKKMTSRKPSRRPSVVPSRRASAVEEAGFSEDIQLARTRSALEREQMEKVLNEMVQELAAGGEDDIMAAILNNDETTASTVSNSQNRLNDVSESASNEEMESGTESASNGQQNAGNGTGIGLESASNDHQIASRSSDCASNDQQYATNIEAHNGTQNTTNNNQKASTIECSPSPRSQSASTGTNEEDAVSNEHNVSHKSSAEQRRSSIPAAIEAWN